MYRSVEALYYTPETNIMPCINYTGMKYMYIHTHTHIYECIDYEGFFKEIEPSMFYAHLSNTHHFPRSLWSMWLQFPCFLQRWQYSFALWGDR